MDNGWAGFLTNNNFVIGGNLMSQLSAPTRTNMALQLFCLGVSRLHALSNLNSTSEVSFALTNILTSQLLCSNARKGAPPLEISPKLTILVVAHQVYHPTSYPPRFGCRLAATKDSTPTFYWHSTPSTFW